MTEGCCVIEIGMNKINILFKNAISKIHTGEMARYSLRAE
jgi:hypothetical protein